jgi:hypothetical protein
LPYLLADQIPFDIKEGFQPGNLIYMSLRQGEKFWDVVRRITGTHAIYDEALLTEKGYKRQISLALNDEFDEVSQRVRDNIGIPAVCALFESLTGREIAVVATNNIGQADSLSYTLNFFTGKGFPRLRQYDIYVKGSIDDEHMQALKGYNVTLLGQMLRNKMQEIARSLEGVDLDEAVSAVVAAFSAIAGFFTFFSPSPAAP